MTSTLLYREAVPDDEDVLWSFLAIAAYEPSAVVAKGVPVVAAHLVGWQRLGDFGIIAERDGKPVGAAWARQFLRSEEPTFYAGSKIPEISIATIGDERGKGIGVTLLHCLAEMAKRQQLEGLCLNIRDGNPAERLYERSGFRRIEGSQVQNRVGGFSFGMLLKFQGSNQ